VSPFANAKPGNIDNTVVNDNETAKTFAILLFFI